MNWKHASIGGLTALLCATGVGAQERIKNDSFPAPKHFSVNLHTRNRGDTPDLAALEKIAKNIDMARVSNKILYQNGDERNNTYENLVIADDPYLESLSEMLGWERILLLINDKNDFSSPKITDAVNSSETGFVQRTVQAFPQIKYVQIYNEPCNFDNLCWGEYVLHLKAAYEWIHDVENPRRRVENNMNAFNKEYEPKPELVVVSAATFGSSNGIPEFEMNVRAGMLEYCDIVGIHDYTSAMTLEFAEMLADYGYADKPMWMTETGYPDWSQHLMWYGRMVEMEQDMTKYYDGHVAPQMFWYSFWEGQDTVAGYNQFGLMEKADNEEGWRATNDEMFNTLKARPRSSLLEEEEPAQRVIMRYTKPLRIAPTKPGKP